MRATVRAGMPKVLIVSPYFPPSTLAGVHRARHLAKWLPAAGWKPIVVCVDEAFHEHKLDPGLVHLLPRDFEPVKVGALPSSLSRVFGIGDISLRAWPALRRAVLQIAAKDSVKAALITGSPFYSMSLAPLLKQRFGLPVVLDYQDPWTSDWAAHRPLLSKAGLTYQISKILEPMALRAAAHVTTVSVRQHEDLIRRYPWLGSTPRTDIPIGADPGDLSALGSYASPYRASMDGRFTIAYVGTIWPLVIPTLRSFLRAVALLRDRPDIYSRLRILFVGTSGIPSNTTTMLVRSLAEDEGVGDVVEEVPERVPYLDALSITGTADANLILGSDEPHYTASKLYGILMSGRPYLSVLHSESSAHAVCQQAGGGIPLTFSSAGHLEKQVPIIADAIVRLVLSPQLIGRVSRAAYAEFEASRIAQRFADIFDSLRHTRSPPAKSSDAVRSSRGSGDQGRARLRRRLKRVLCVSPHFPPANAADMHRLRLSLPHFREYGWEPVVFTVDPTRIEVDHDPLLLDTVPHDIEIHRVGAAPQELTRYAGLGNLGIRSWLPLRRTVSHYLSSNHVDLIFFSTTVFTSIAHGPFWKRQSHAPLVVDLQDPWRNDYYLSLPTSQLPKKFLFDFAQKSYLERRTMPHIDGIIAVSSAYIEMMRSRYPALRQIEAIELPFGASEHDLEVARRLPSKRDYDGKIQCLYIGRGGPDLARALEGLFEALARLRQTDPQLASQLRFEFIGTSYASGGRGQYSIRPVAERFGVADQVLEDPKRLPYFEALRALTDADILIIPGSDDSGYTPSKLYPYILAERPLLTILHERSSAAVVLRETNAGDCVTFSDATSRKQIVDSVYTKLKSMANALPLTIETDWNRFEPYTARSMTRQCCELFDRVLERSRKANPD